MPSLEQAIQRERLEGEYQQLKNGAPRVVKRAQVWKAELDALRAQTSDPEEVAEIDKLQTDLVSALRLVFGL